MFLVAASSELAATFLIVGAFLWYYSCEHSFAKK